MSDNLDGFAKSGIYKERINNTLAAFLSVLSTSVLVLLISFIPADVDISEYEDLLLPYIYKLCIPEPHEFTQYVVAVLTIPIFFIIFYKIICQITLKLSGDTLKCFNIVQTFSLIIIMAIFICGYVCIYRGYLIDSRIDILYLIIAFLFAFALMLMYRTKIVLGLSYAKRRFVFFAMMIVTILSCSIITSQLNFMQSHLMNTLYHYYAWWYPIFKVGSGQVIGVDFHCLYGFYPYLVVPFLRLFGGINQRSAILFLLLLFIIISISYYFFSYRFIEDKILAGIAATAASLFGPFSVIHDDGFSNIYIQYSPTRTFFIALCLLLITVNSILKSNKLRLILFLFSCPVFALGMVWNFESGIIAVFIWIVYLIYEKARAEGLFSIAVLKCFLTMLLFFAMSLLLSYGLIQLITYSLSGQYLTVRDMLFGILIFGGTGFYSLPMTPGIWFAFAAVIIIGLFHSIPAVIGKSRERKAADRTTGIFVLSITMAGAFSYFMGRSYPTNVLSFAPYMSISCMMLAEERDRFISPVKFCVFFQEKIIIFKDIFIKFCFLFLACVILPYGLLNLSLSVFCKTDNRYDIDYFTLYNNADTIRYWSENYNEGKMPNILINQSIYVDEILGKDADEIVCEQIDWFYRENAYTYIDFINKNSDECFVIDDKGRNKLIAVYSDEWNAAISGFYCTDINGLHFYSPNELT